MNDCQKFERRIQELMDSRIDPETDEALCAHTAICDSCYENLMAYSLLHTTYLQDSDSMKIKLENLGLHEAMFKQKKETPNHKHLFALAASIAALILVMAALTSQFFVGNEKPAELAAMKAPTVRRQIEGLTKDDRFQNVSFESFVIIKETLNQNEIYSSISELPGLKPFKTISDCFDWFHRSFFGFGTDGRNGSEKTPNLGQRFDRDRSEPYPNHLQFAFCF